ncbi:ZP domain-containing protein [Aphelenchoides besseyi]|nr:ZP domain-containing protein [Aphelenchoides besseyi]KAI6219918.1 ZP domain-containing protein [Aphelenchoides besseyi]
MHLLNWLLLLSWLIEPTNAYDMDNHIIGTPQVQCAENNIALDIITKKPFEGNIYVKGRAKDSQCRQSYSTNSTKSYALALGKCGMQRLRTTNPRGVNFALTIVVSFHKSGFITKNDRAFSIRCFYQEPEEVVTNSIEVSAIPTMELSDSMGIPTCNYEVRGSLNGPILNFVNVGESVYHIWSCSPTSAMGMLVKKCFVTDGDGEQHLVIDENGCTSDSSLLDDIVYDKDLMRAHAMSQAFKYADSNQLYFTCQIRLCQKQMGMCDGVTPPKCGRTADAEENDEKDELWNDKAVASLLDDSPENVTSLNNRDRRALMNTPTPMELDLASEMLFVIDQDERRQLDVGRLCVSKSYLPLIPIGFFIGFSFATIFAISCYKTYFMPKKQLLFY